MAKIDLSKMTLEELKAHSKEVIQAIQDYDRKTRAEALAAMEEVAAKYGFRPSDLIGGGGLKAPKAGKAAQPAKYRHPENPLKTWSGRGRKPGWIVEGLAQGQKIEDYAI